MSHIYVLGDPNNTERYKVGVHSGSLKKLANRYRTYIPDVDICEFIQTPYALTVEKELKRSSLERVAFIDTGNDSEWYRSDYPTIHRAITNIINRLEREEAEHIRKKIEREEEERTRKRLEYERCINPTNVSYNGVFNIGHRTGLDVEPITALIEICYNMLTRDYREVMFYDHVTCDLYYLLVNTKRCIVKMDTSKILVIPDDPLSKLERYFCHHSLIHTSKLKRNSHYNGMIGSMMLSGTNYVVIDDSIMLIEQVEATPVVQQDFMEWFYENPSPKNKENLLNKYNALNPTNKLNIKEFGAYLDRQCVDISYRSGSKNALEQLQVGCIVKSCFKSSNTICYYVYNGIIPEGTRKL